VFVLLIAIGLFVVVPAALAFDSSPALIKQFYVQHRNDLQTGLFIASLGVFFFVWFLGSLVSHLHGAEGRRRRLTAIVFGGGLIFIRSRPRRPAPHPHLRTRTERLQKGTNYQGFCYAPGWIRTSDFPLRRNIAQEAKEGQKWLWQARCVAAERWLIPADKGRFGWVWATETRRWPKRLDCAWVS
jgi:hypothetical protein